MGRILVRGAVSAFCAVALAAATLAAFSAAGRFGIVNCDDLDYLLKSNAIFGVENSIWMPLTWLSYSLESALGFDWGQRHWTSIAIHAVNAVLLFALLRRLFPRSVLVAAFAAFFWAVHPLRAESVAWLASRKDVLSTFFFLAALIAWVRSARWGLGIALGLLALGAAAKPSVMVIPVFVAAIDFLVVGRRKPWWAYGAAVALAGVIAVEATWAQAAGGACETLSVVPLWYRLWNAASAVTVYLGNTFAFEGMAAQCVVRYPLPPRFSLFGAAVLVGIAWYLVRGRSRPAQGGLAVFLVSLAPFLGIIGFGVHAFADRFTILPALGLSIAACALLEREWIPRPVCEKAVCCAVGVAVCGILFAETRRQVAYWEDERILFTHTLEVDGPRNHLARAILAGYYYEFDHDMERVYEHLSAIAGDKWEDYGHYGAMFMESALATGHVKEAEEFFEWLSGWDSRAARKFRAAKNLPPWYDADCGTRVYKLANVLRLAFRKDPEFRQIIDDQFRAAAKFGEKNHAVRCVAYRLALLDGRDGEAERIAAQDAEGDPYMKNRWAFRKPDGKGAAARP